ncbi:hypothetical protein TRFO_23612 [Tritrichomonas foetus]|uniref:Zinc finger PHD-type domain-containing protein n=1 Tax=Tritrichomonas foetus TaxID=1144522 RepID=A0A1J4KA12_9EUKA|nr:hypothetical protein TRFO_23612 [Tritrichomonas foetus]|eukprot:OHT08067.1 hypothetical protein TRFO_23612 [Tritrichomonas foetus]
MQEQSDFERLAALATLASPSHRQTAQKQDSHHYTPPGEPIVRCVCRKLTNSNNTILCSQCNSLLHIECLEENVTPDSFNYVCPFCRNSSSEILINSDIDIGLMHHEIRNTKASGKYDDLLKSAQSISQVTKELQKAAAWVETLCSRDDVYDSILTTADACIDGCEDTGVEDELISERSMMKEISLFLHKIAEESEKYKSPILDCVLDQIVTHPL